MELEHRLSRLERSNRILMTITATACIVALALTLSGVTNSIPDVIRARSFEVVGDNGEVAIRARTVGNWGHIQVFNLAPSSPTSSSSTVLAPYGLVVEANFPDSSSQVLRGQVPDSEIPRQPVVKLGVTGSDRNPSFGLRIANDQGEEIITLRTSPCMVPDGRICRSANKGAYIELKR